MSDNLLKDFIEREGYKGQMSDADNKLIEANTKLVDEKRILKTELDKTYKIIDKALEYIKEHIRIDDEYPAYMEMLVEEKDELLKILEGDEYEE